MNSVGSVNSQNYNYYNYYNYPPQRRYYRQEPSEPDTAKTVTYAGILQLIVLGLQKASDWCGQKLMQGNEFTTEKNVKQIADYMKNHNNLDVTIDYLDKNNIKRYPNALQKELEVVARGENAFYTDQLKLAVAPKSKPSLILHELGHAINAQTKKAFKYLQKSRHVALATIPMATVTAAGMFKREDGKPNFFERNALSIGFLAYLPTIIEEGLASIHGVKAAGKFVKDKSLLNPLKRNYAFAWMTYLIAGIATAIGVKQTIIENKKA